MSRKIKPTMEFIEIVTNFYEDISLNEFLNIVNSVLDELDIGVRFDESGPYKVPGRPAIYECKIWSEDKGKCMIDSEDNIDKMDIYWTIREHTGKIEYRIDYFSLIERNKRRIKELIDGVYEDVLIE